MFLEQNLKISNNKKIYLLNQYFLVLTVNNIVDIL